MSQTESQAPSRTGSQAQPRTESQAHSQGPPGETTAPSPQSRDQPSPKPEDNGAAQDPSRPPEISKQVYILGFTTKAKFIAHSLAHVPQIPPVRILTHHSTRAVNTWLNGKKAIDLHDGSGNFLSSHAILCPQYIGPKIGTPRIDMWEGETLDNIIMNTSGRSVYPTLRLLRPFINSRTVLCLVTEGIGLVDKLNEEVFDNPAERPMYILGHLTHKIFRHKGKEMSVRLRSPRAHFLLTALPTEQGTDEHDVARRKPFVELLALSDVLNPIPMDHMHFLHRKLPGMIWSSASDAVCVILGCRYDQIQRDLHAVRLWHGLVNEAIHIASSLPEFPPHMAQVFNQLKFKVHLVWKLKNHKMVYSEWVSLIRKGEITPVDSVNGYFVRRAVELGLPHKVHRMAISMVKARHEARISELEDDIPYSLRPYMLDSDRLGGQEFMNDQDLEELDLNV